MVIEQDTDHSQSKRHLQCSNTNAGNNERSLCVMMNAPFRPVKNAAVIVIVMDDAKIMKVCVKFKNWAGHCDSPILGTTLL